MSTSVLQIGRGPGRFRHHRLADPCVRRPRRSPEISRPEALAAEGHALGFAPVASGPLGLSSDKADETLRAIRSDRRVVADD